MFSNKLDRMIKTYNFLTGLSDHNAIFFSRKLTKKRLRCVSKSMNIKKTFIPNNQEQHLMAALNNFDWTSILSYDDTNKCCDLLYSAIKGVLSQFQKESHLKKRVYSLPWINTECKKLMRLRDQLLKKSLQSGLNTDRLHFISARNKVTQTLRMAKANFFMTVINSAKGNCKLIWENINKLLGNSKHKADTDLELKFANELVSEPLSLATKLNDFFQSTINEIAQLFSNSYDPQQNIGNIDTKEDVSSPDSKFNIQKITENEVENIISKLRSSKARDEFGFDINFLKHYKSCLLVPVTHLINLSITQAVVPLSWKVAKVTPIYKSCDKTDPANYRPISILPIFSKIAEKWVANSIINHHNDSNPGLHPMQFGFRTLHSTETAVCVFVEKVKSYLDKSSCVAAVFLDFKRAFDTVNHLKLLSRLSTFNFSNHTVKWIQSYLSDRKQCVQIKNSKSPYLYCTQGVPQGSILGPLLFSLYVNDLPNVCKNVDTIMYADDTVIFTQAKTADDAAHQLSLALHDLQKWLNDSCLCLNFKKTVSMFFSKPKTTVAAVKVCLGAQELINVEEFKYLGVLIDSKLSFKKHIRKVVKTVNVNIQNFRHIRTSLTDTAAITFLHSMILAHIEYCITSWSYTSSAAIGPIEVCYKRALKILDKKPFSYHHCQILDKYKFLNFTNFKLFKSACLIYKVIHGLAPPPMSDFIKQKSSSVAGSRLTRATVRGDCELTFRRTTFSQNALSYQ